jgi:hypothetical protein
MEGAIYLGIKLEGVSVGSYGMKGEVKTSRCLNHYVFKNTGLQNMFVIFKLLLHIDKKYQRKKHQLTFIFEVKAE